MDYLQNHCWCSVSHWDNTMYDCRHLVTLNSYLEGYKDDWKDLIVSDERCTNNLRQEVIDWLNENIKDTSKPYGGNKTTKAWCIGNYRYRCTDSSSSFSIFFQRKKDAMAFIKRWSKWEKPINYCQYFTDVRKKLDLVTGKYSTR